MKLSCLWQCTPFVASNNLTAAEVWNTERVHFAPPTTSLQPWVRTQSVRTLHCMPRHVIQHKYLKCLNTDQGRVRCELQCFAVCTHEVF